MNNYITPLPYPVDINFDEAIEAWMSNKTKVSGTHYKYICAATTKKGTKCLNPPSCKIHASKKAKLTSK
jgi:hypothetical protein